MIADRVSRLLRHCVQRPLGAAAAIACFGATLTAAEIQLAGNGIRVRVVPETLKLVCTDANGRQLEVSEAFATPETVSGVEPGASTLRWQLPARGLDVRLAVQDRTCSVRMRGSQVGELAWPRFVPDASAMAWVVPFDEGSYVPLDDPEWMDHLVAEGVQRLPEALSMPFLGIDYGDSTATLIAATPFNTVGGFSKTTHGLAYAATHTFTRLDRQKEYGWVIRFGTGAPIEPARQYRKWLQDQDALIGFGAKIKEVPRAERLLGAMHAYLWEAGYMHRLDVKNWAQFCTRISQQASGPLPSPGKHLFSLLSPTAQQAVQRLSKSGAQATNNVADQEAITQELNALLDSSGLYQREAWAKIPIPDETSRYLRAGLDRSLPSQRAQANASLLAIAFNGGELEKLENWGDGISLRQLKDLQTAGIDRACLVLNDLNAGRRRPEVAERANQMGYLYAPYDSYHSLHAPTETDSWDTAQFDGLALENGPILRADGTRVPGFKGKGYRFSPLVARPYVERRVVSTITLSPFNAWFVDCDATGESYDNYSEVVPSTEGGDFAARMDRLRWISKTFNAPVGSEKGSGLGANALHFAHGMLTPPLGWRDPVFTNRTSPYWQGGYSPAGAPDIFFKPVPLPPAIRKFYLDPKYRLPLYQLVYHDAVVTTHHWQSSSLKFSEEQTSTALLEQLYNVPPLYHLNRDTWLAQAKRIATRHRFFSPLHRELGLQAMTDFLWLTPDRSVQMTVFANGTLIVANFGQEAWQSEAFKLKVPPLSVAAKRAKGSALVLTP